MKLLFHALTKYLAGLALISLLLFVPAGTIHFTNAWLLIGLLFIPMFFLGVILFIKTPDLLNKRLQAKEKDGTQKNIVAWSALIFFFGFIVAALDHRFQWSNVPSWVVAVSSFILLISYVFYAEVMRENVYLSRTIEIQKNQVVVDRGLYGIVRHPMYAVTIWLFFSIPLILGSYFSLLCFIPYLPIIISRILNEERMLEQHLSGYAEYKRRVKYRLIPYIW